MSLSARRAWIEIKVVTASDWASVSLSARRAWIEIRWGVTCLHRAPVALRKESVDRNPIVPVELTTLVKSLSARRAWIEIRIRAPSRRLCPRRSPQGERG